MNKAGLTILLLLSAVLVLYPSITALIDAQDAISRLGSSIPTAVMKVRDNAILQVVGLIILYVFLYMLLGVVHDRKSTQQGKPNNDVENQPTQQVRQSTSKRINSQWSIVAGILAGIGVSAWTFISDYGYYGSNIFEIMHTYIIYGVIAGFVVGIGFYFLFKHVIEVER